MEARGIVSADQRGQIDAEIGDFLQDPVMREKPSLWSELQPIFSEWSRFGPASSLAIGFGGAIVQPEFSRLDEPRRAFLDRQRITEPGLMEAVLDLWSGLDREELTIRMEEMKSEEN